MRGRHKGFLPGGTFWRQATTRHQDWGGPSWHPQARAASGLHPLALPQQEPRLGSLLRLGVRLATPTYDHCVLLLPATFSPHDVAPLPWNHKGPLEGKPHRMGDWNGQGWSRNECSRVPLFPTSSASMAPGAEAQQGHRLRLGALQGQWGKGYPAVQAPHQQSCSRQCSCWATSLLAASAQCAAQSPDGWGPLGTRGAQRRVGYQRRDAKAWVRAGDPATPAVDRTGQTAHAEGPLYWRAQSEYRSTSTG